MNEARKKNLLETIELLKDRRQQLRDISIEVAEKQRRMPETESFYSLRSHLSDASDALDEAESLLGGLIEDTEMELTGQTASVRPVSANGELAQKETLAEKIMTYTPSSGLAEEPQPKKGITASQVIVAIVMGIFFIPIGYLLFTIGIKSFDEFLGMLFTIIGVMFMLGPLLAFIPGVDKVSGPSSGSVFGSSDILSSSDSDVHKSNWSSDEDSVRKDIYAKQDEDLSILEDMIQMHSVNPDADLEEHYGWDHKIDFDQDGDNGGW